MNITVSDETLDYFENDSREYIIDSSAVTANANGSLERWITSGHMSSYLLWSARVISIAVGLWALRILSHFSSIADRIAYSQGVALCIYIGMCLVNEIPFPRDETWDHVYCYFDASVKISTMTYLHGTESLIALSRCLDVVKALFMRRFRKQRIFWCSFLAVSAMAVIKTIVQLLWTTPAPGICKSDVKYYPSWDLVFFLVITGVSYGYMILFVFLRCALMRARMKLNLVSVAATVIIHIFIDAGFMLTLVYLNNKNFLDGDVSFTLIIIFSSLIPLSYVVISTSPRERVRHDLSTCVRVLGARYCCPRCSRPPPESREIPIDVLGRCGRPDDGHQAQGRASTTSKDDDEGSRDDRRASPERRGGDIDSVPVLAVSVCSRCNCAENDLHGADSGDCNSTGDEGDAEAAGSPTRF